MRKLISQLPEDVRVVALQRQREATGDKWDKETDELEWAFNWDNTPEDFDIWGAVCNGNYEPFRAFHANLKQFKSNGWIRVDERLPETSDNVLAILDGERCCMSYFDFTENGQTFKVWGYVYDGLNGDAIYDDDYKPTHWQPLPPPPAKP